jgi:hypothetical protein
VGKSTPNKKKLVFVLRDFHDEEHNLEDLKTSFTIDINKAWVPNGRQISDYFDIEYVSLAHFTYEKDKFIEQVDQLRTRF